MVLMLLTTLANLAIAGIASLIPKPDSADGFLHDVTGIDTSGRASAWEMVKDGFASFSQWSTWVEQPAGVNHPRHQLKRLISPENLDRPGQGRINIRQ